MCQMCHMSSNSLFTPKACFFFFLEISWKFAINISGAVVNVRLFIKYKRIKKVGLVALTTLKH